MNNEVLAILGVADKLVAMAEVADHQGNEAVKRALIVEVKILIKAAQAIAVRDDSMRVLLAGL